jgi:hypothetical protein
MNYLTYRIELAKLNRRLKKVHARISRLTEEIKKAEGPKAAHEASQAEAWEIFMVDDDIAYLRTRYFRSKADKMLLSLPERKKEDGYWEESDYLGRWVLTMEGIAHVRELIRKEQKERLEVTSHRIAIWTGILTALTGLIGVLIGFVAIVSH